MNKHPVFKGILWWTYLKFVFRCHQRLGSTCWWHHKLTRTRFLNWSDLRVRSKKIGGTRWIHGFPIASCKFSHLVLFFIIEKIVVSNIGHCFGWVLKFRKKSSGRWKRPLSAYDRNRSSWVLIELLTSSIPYLPSCWALILSYATGRFVFDLKPIQNALLER